MKNYNLKKDTMNEGDLKKIYIYPIHPSNSKTTTSR